MAYQCLLKKNIGREKEYSNKNHGDGLGYRLDHKLLLGTPGRF